MVVRWVIGTERGREEEGLHGRMTNYGRGEVGAVWVGATELKLL